MFLILLVVQNTSSCFFQHRHINDSGSHFTTIYKQEDIKVSKFLMKQKYNYKNIKVCNTVVERQNSSTL